MALLTSVQVNVNVACDDV